MKKPRSLKIVRWIILLLASGVLLLGGIGIWTVYKSGKIKNSQTKTSPKKQNWKKN